MQNKKAYKTKEYRKQFFFGRNIEKQKQIKILKFLKKAETDQKYEETDLKFEETDQQFEIFKNFEKSEN